MPGSAVSPVTPRPDFGDGNSLRVEGSSTLPFSARDRDQKREGIVVHVKVLTTDDEETRRVIGLIQRTLEGIEIDGKRVAPIVTDSNVEISSIELEKLGNHVTPVVCKRLGVSFK